MTEQATPTQEAPIMQPYEAGFSTNFFMTHAVMGKQQFTFRGAFASDFPYVMDQARQFVKQMKEHGWQTEGDLILQGPQTVNAPKSAPTSAPEAPGATQSTGGVQSFTCEKLEITPKADGKAEMKFYASGHKYPDIYSTLPVANCITVLMDVGAWTAEYFEKAGEYNVNFVVDWRESEKLNRNGKPYKDLVKVRAA